MNPIVLLVTVVLIVLVVLLFIQAGWKSASGALLIALTALVIVRLLGIWNW